MPIRPTIPKYWEKDAEEEDMPEFMKPRKEFEEVSTEVVRPSEELEGIEEMGETLSEEEALEKKLAEMEIEAEKRMKAVEQKRKIRGLKKDVRKAEFKEKLEPLEPVATLGKKVGREAKKTGKGLYRFGKAFIEASKERQAQQMRAEDVTTGKKYDMTSQDGMGMGLKKDEKYSITSGEGVSSSIGRGGQTFDFGKKKEPKIAMTIKKKTQYEMGVGKRGAVSPLVKKEQKFKLDMGKRPGSVGAMVGKGSKYDLNLVGKTKYKLGREK